MVTPEKKRAVQIAQSQDRRYSTATDDARKGAAAYDKMARERPLTPPRKDRRIP